MASYYDNGSFPEPQQQWQQGPPPPPPQPQQASFSGGFAPPSSPGGGISYDSGQASYDVGFRSAPAGSPSPSQQQPAYQDASYGAPAQLFQSNPGYSGSTPSAQDGFSGPATGTTFDAYARTDAVSGDPALVGQPGDRGIMGAVAGGAAGIYMGRKAGHGFMGMVAGAIIGSMSEDALKKKKKEKKQQQMMYGGRRDVQGSDDDDDDENINGVNGSNAYAPGLNGPAPLPPNGAPSGVEAYYGNAQYAPPQGNSAYPSVSYTQQASYNPQYY